MYELMPYQIAGATWLSGCSQALLGDEMGVGKTAQAIHAADLTGAVNILVVCPAAATVNWSREFTRFSSTPRDIQVILASKKVKINPGTTVLSYGLITNAVIQSALQDVPWDILILDEAHFLKERTAARTKAVYGDPRRKKPGLMSYAKRCWRLTGTPMPNSADELWTHLKSSGVINLSYWDFVARYCSGYNSNFGFKITGTKNTEELKEILKPFILRRKKEDVLADLPPITFSEVTVSRSDVELDPFFYEQYRAIGIPKFMQALKEHDTLLRSAMAVTTGDKYGAVTRDSVSVLEGLAGSMITLRRYLAMAKIPLFCAMITEELLANAYEKIVIFAVHKDPIETMRQQLIQFNPVTLYGKTPADKRQRNVDKFQKDPKCRVFIGNIQAAGTAITLTSANQVAFLEADWSPANNAQACMRCHRIGQVNPVRVRFFNCADSVDEQVSHALMMKTRQIAKILD